MCNSPYPHGLLGLGQERVATPYYSPPASGDQVLAAVAALNSAVLAAKRARWDVTVEVDAGHVTASVSKISDLPQVKA